MKKCILFTLVCFLIVVLCICGSSIEYEKTQIEHRGRLDLKSKQIFKRINCTADLIYLSKELDSLNKFKTYPYFQSLHYYISGLNHENENDTYLSLQYFIKSLTTSNKQFIEKRDLNIHFSALYKTIRFLISDQKFELADQLINYGIDIIDTTDFHYPKWKMYYSKANLFYKQNDQSNCDKALETINDAAIAGAKYKPLFYNVSLNLRGLLEVSFNELCHAENTFKSILNNPNSTINYRRLAFHNLSFIEIQRKNFDQSIIYLKKSKELTDENLSSSLLYLTNLDLCEVYLNLNEIDSAVQYGLKAEKLYESVNRIPDHFKIFKFLSQAYFQKGKYELSNHYMKKYTEENEKWIYRTETAYYQLNIEEQIAGFLAKPIVPSRKNGLSIDVIISWVSSIFFALYIGGMIQQVIIKRKATKAFKDFL